MVILSTFHRIKLPSEFPKTNSDFNVNQIINPFSYPKATLKPKKMKRYFKFLKSHIFFIWRLQKQLQCLEG